MLKRGALLLGVVLLAGCPNPTEPGKDASVHKRDGGAPDAEEIIQVGDTGPRTGDGGNPVVGDGGLPTVDWCILQFPSSATIALGAKVTIFGQVYVQGETNQAGARPNVEGQVGYGTQGTNGSTDTTWTWSAAAFNKDDTTSVNNDEYKTDVSPVIGTYGYAYRFRTKGGPWTFCDVDGSTNGYDLAKQGALTVTAVKPPSIGWCNITSPSTASVKQGEAATIFGQVLATGVTDSVGQGAGIVGQVGYGPVGSDPRTATTWNWVGATYDTDIGGANDQYKGSLSPALPGSYAYGYRFRLGAGDYFYCDTDGNDGTAGAFDITKLGALEVKTLSVDWCNVQFPPSANLTVGDTFTAFGEVWVKGVTELSGAGANVDGQLGVGPQGSDGSTDASWTWTDATFNKDDVNNDEYKASTASGAVGAYEYAYRFRYKGGAWTYCDLDSSTNGFQKAKQGQLTVSAVKPAAVDWCTLKFPASASQTVGQTTTIFGQVFVAGVTDTAGTGANVDGQVGIGAKGTDGSTDGTWTWTAATYNKDDGNNDEYKASLSPAAVGDYEYAYRFRYKTGAWTYCDLDSSTNGYLKAQQGALTVAATKPPTIDWCNLQWPPTGTLNVGDTLTVYGRVWVNGVTTLVGQGANIEGQIGLGAPTTDGSTDGTWTWTAATYSKDVDGMVAGDHFNDEYTASLSPAAGSYAYAYRFRYQGGPWTYCDSDGSTNAYDKALQGALTVKVVPPATIDYCVLQWPASGNVIAGTPLTIYGQVYKAGVTEPAGAGALIDAQYGFGAAGTDGSTDASWTWTAATFNKDVSNNDEYKGDLTPGPGNFSYAYRFRYKGGPWAFCDLDGSLNGFDKAQEGLLTVTAQLVPWVQLRPLVAPVENVGAKLLVTGEVYLATVTDAAGQGAGITAEVGIGVRGSATSDASWVWTAAAYLGDAPGGGTANNDLYGGWIVAPAAGAYDVAMRFVYATKTYYADLDASTDGYQSAEAAQLTTFAEVLPSANGVNWCNVQWPLTTTAAPGAQTDLIFGQVWIPGVTDHAGSDGRVAAQLGFGAGGSDPRTAQWTWLPATWNADSGSNDEYKASFTAPATAGTYRYVYRMRLLSGWTYCNTDPGVNDAHPFDPAKAGTLTVQ